MAAEGSPNTALQHEISQAIVGEARDRQVRGIKSLSLDGETMQEVVKAFRLPQVPESVVASFTDPNYRLQIASDFLAETKDRRGFRKKMRLLTLTLSV